MAAITSSTKPLEFIRNPIVTLSSRENRASLAPRYPPRSLPATAATSSVTTKGRIPPMEERTNSVPINRERQRAEEAEGRPPDDLGGLSQRLGPCQLAQQEPREERPEHELHSGPLCQQGHPDGEDHEDPDG